MRGGFTWPAGRGVASVLGVCVAAATWPFGVLLVPVLLPVWALARFGVAGLGYLVLAVVVVLGVAYVPMALVNCWAAGAACADPAGLWGLAAGLLLLGAAGIWVVALSHRRS